MSRKVGEDDFTECDQARENFGHRQRGGAKTESYEKFIDLSVGTKQQSKLSRFSRS